MLLLGHIDTVYPMGTLSTMPCRVADGRLWGPGALDMKSGIALILHALEGLRAWHSDSLPRPVTVLLVSDEEVGSGSSRRITESLARKSGAVLVLEPSYGIQGAVKTARKGVGEYTIKVTGKAAHSGLDFEKGESAIVEMAKQITAISKLVDLKRGLTLNVGLVSGGTRTNVIPAQATASLDVRVARMKDAAVIDRQLTALKPFNRRCKLEIKGGVNRPPLERTAGVAMLYKKAVGDCKAARLEAGRSICRRRLGRELHRQPGNPHAGWPGRSRRRRPRHSRVHHDFRIAAPDNASGGTDRGRVSSQRLWPRATRPRRAPKIGPSPTAHPQRNHLETPGGGRMASPARQACFDYGHRVA